MPVIQVSVVVMCRAQLVVIGGHGFMNIYAPSGSNMINERATFFARDLFEAMSLNSGLSWWLAGDFNFVLSVLDVEDGVGY